MPEFVKRSVGSPAGTRLADGTIVWPRAAKNSTNRRRISAAGRASIRGSCTRSGVGIGRNGTERAMRSDPPAQRDRTPAGALPPSAIRCGGLRARGLPLARSAAVAPLPEGRAGDRGPDQDAERDAPGERRGSLLVAGRSLLDSADHAIDRGRQPDAVAHGPTFGRRVGPRIATTDTNPIPTQAIADADSNRKSPIRSRSIPSRPPTASPAHAPRVAASRRNGSWAPADPRISTYRPVWKIPTRRARTGAGPIIGRQ